MCMVCMYVYILVYACIYVHGCMSTHVRTCLDCLDVHIVHIDMYMHCVCICAHEFMCTHICICVHAQEHVCA